MTDPVIRWSAHPPVAIEESTLSTNENAFLDWLKLPSNQNLTRSEILARSPLESDETLSVLDKFIAAGVLELGEDSDDPGSVAYHDDGIPRKLGRFEVEASIGRGSMGAVLLAKDPAIARTVAIKLIQTASHLSPAQRDKYRERFYREASAAGQLHHPSITTVFDVGHTEDGTPFLVMELVKGMTLRDLLETRKPSLAQSLQIARDVLEALGFAHSQGIVHRDIKPSNIMVTSDFRAKIMDFGIAHVEGSELTSAGEVLGSPYYMAPEQLSKGPITPGTDLFSFAVVFYRILTGHLPFTGDSFAAVAQAILHEKPIPPERIDPSIPKAISRLVLRCLNKAPGDRSASAPDVLRELTAIESGNAERKPRVRKSLLIGFAAALAALITVQVAALKPKPVAVAEDVERSATIPVPLPEPPSVALPPAVSAAPAGPVTTTAPVSAPVPPAPKAPKQPKQKGAPTNAEMFYEARLALERGELEESKKLLETLLGRDPSFAGSADLYGEVMDQIWQTRLPFLLPARHRHRMGGCTGELSLASLGVRFRSPDHDWAFTPEEVRVAERPDDRTITIETFEKDALSFRSNKRYRFDLETPLAEEDWTRYQRLLR